LAGSARSAGFQPAVSRVSNPQAARSSTPCRLEVGDTAGWKPALLKTEGIPSEPALAACLLDFKGTNFNS
jgi:hypothetical protein